MFENVQTFLPPKCFLQDVFHSTNRLPYHTTADKVDEFVLGRFMLVLGVSRWFLGVLVITDYVVLFRPISSQLDFFLLYKILKVNCSQYYTV